ncbi:hypothetical protein [Falsiroseomonas selenitidurans]|uniref:Transmembrane protein n=1 Tax=Falsiroseomonas selenitidurans TaxID=2716335 RepID=A0ABX1E7C2_9PROT|nr:hypothetical protein [Falsiroseomonas selenitidurans]NKC33109.1 hypothetical protein [Falsiroseomonas selenitidurans]
MMEYRPSLRRKCAGWSLIALAPVGGLLPVLPGAVFFALGLFVLRHQYLWAHRGLGWAASRWPTTVEKVEAMEVRMIQRADRTGQRLRRLFRLG